jgi:hypothetical protein
MSIKERAMEVYNQHLHLAATDGRLFRKTVMEQLAKEFNASIASVATHYNNCKKAVPVAGLGRAVLPKGVRKASSKGKDKAVVPDNECFTVIELIPTENGQNVGRCESFLLQGDASEKFDARKNFWPSSAWVMIQGLGPNSGETYKLGIGEKELKRYELEQA